MEIQARRYISIVTNEEPCVYSKKKAFMKKEKRELHVRREACRKRLRCFSGYRRLQYEPSFLHRRPPRGRLHSFLFSGRADRSKFSRDILYKVNERTIKKKMGQAGPDKTTHESSVGVKQPRVYSCYVYELIWRRAQPPHSRTTKKRYRRETRK